MAILSVVVTAILGLIVACTLFLNGYKKQANLIRQGVYGFVSVYALLVVVIGLWG